MSLQYLTLADLGEIFDGPHATPKRKTEGPYFLNIASLVDGRLDLTQSDHVSREDFHRWTRRVTPRAGDLLFSYETRLGDAALMPAGIEACLGRRMALLRPHRERVDPRFILYFYLSPAFREIIDRHTIHGATVNRIGLSTMGSWPVAIPALPEQQAIAEVLGALDDKIAANTKTAHKAEALLAAEFAAMRIAEEPENQDVAISLQELVELNPAVSRPSEEEPVYVDMQKLPVSGMSITDWTTRPAKGGTRFENGDTLLARITPCLENRKTGYVDFLNDGQTAIGSTEYIVLRSRPHIPPELSYFLAISERFRSFAIRHMVGTSGRQRVAAADLANFQVSSPEATLLDAFGRKSGGLFAMLKSQRDENRTLSQIRDALLPQLMSGKIRVKDAETTGEEVL